MTRRKRSAPQVELTPQQHQRIDALAAAFRRDRMTWTPTPKAVWVHVIAANYHARLRIMPDGEVQQAGGERVGPRSRRSRCQAKVAKAVGA